MTLVRADQVRAAIIASMKANATILATLTDTDEIRESSWNGTEFSYPNYRVRINQIPKRDDCYQELEASIYCYSEKQSSQEAEEMAGTVANEYDDTAFTQSGIRFNSISVDIIPAIKETNLEWRGEVILRSAINLI